MKMSPLKVVPPSEGIVPHPEERGGPRDLTAEKAAEVSGGPIIDNDF